MGIVSDESFQTLDLNLEKLLDFFDKKSCGSSGHATSLVSVFGEELGIALLRKYCEEEGRNYEFHVLDDVCSKRKRSGHRLDAWIRIDTKKEGVPVYYFQTEIKNWSAHAIGADSLPSNGDDTKENEVRFKTFRSQFRLYENANTEDICWKDEDKWKSAINGEAELFYEPRNPAAGKAVIDMTDGLVEYSVLKREGNLLRETCNGEKRAQVCPLICYWFPLHPYPKENEYKSADKNFNSNEFFDLRLISKNLGKLKNELKFDKGEENRNFNKLYVFSMSNFARRLKKQNEDNPVIEVKMRLLDARLDWIREIFPPQKK